MSDSDTKLPWPQNVLHDALHKPAATKPCSPCGDGDTEQQYHVHDTGSGEPTCHFCEKGVPRHQQFKDGPFIHYYGDTVTRPCTLSTPPTSTVTLDRELDKAVKRWVNAKREQILREDTRGELLAEVKRQESDVEDAIYEELAALKAGKEGQ